MSTIVATFGPPWPKRSMPEQTGMYALLILPFVATIAAGWLGVLWGFDWHYTIMAVVRYIVTGLAVTVGAHRLFTHESFKTHTWVRVLLCLFFLMSFQGPLWAWVATHILHHRKSDECGKDPHTPLEFGGGWRGFWHAHFGWLLYQYPMLEDDKVVKGLRSEKWIGRLDDHVVYIMVLSLIMPAALGYAYDHSWKGALLGLLWGGGVPIFIVQHVTWLVNSASHVWGKKRFAHRVSTLNDESRDNVWLAPFAFGETLHNFHHVLMTSAVHGYDYRWLDPSYWVIFIMKAKCLHLAWDVKIPTENEVSKYRLSGLT